MGSRGRLDPPGEPAVAGARPKTTRSAARKATLTSRASSADLRIPAPGTAAASWSVSRSSRSRVTVTEAEHHSLGDVPPAHTVLPPSQYSRYAKKTHTYPTDKVSCLGWGQNDNISKFQSHIFL